MHDNKYSVGKLQVEEETGIKLKAADLIDLTAFLKESTGRKMFPSPVTFSSLNFEMHMCG